MPTATNSCPPPPYTTEEPSYADMASSRSYGATDQPAQSRECFKKTRQRWVYRHLHLPGLNPRSIMHRPPYCHLQHQRRRSLRIEQDRILWGRQRRAHNAEVKLWDQERKDHALEVQDWQRELEEHNKERLRFIQETGEHGAKAKEWQHERQLHVQEVAVWRTERASFEKDRGFFERDREEWENQRGLFEREREEWENQRRTHKSFWDAAVLDSPFCLAYDTRRYKARLRNVGCGLDPLQACMSTRIEIQGRDFATPERCDVTVRCFPLLTDDVLNSYDPGRRRYRFLEGRLRPTGVSPPLGRRDVG